MDIISYALCKKIAEHAVSGVQSMSIEGQNLIINTKDSGVLTMTFPTPKDGISVTDIDVNANNQIVFTMSDGSEFISGKIPTVKGESGFSPTITENADNTDKIYKLDITTADSTFTTPNLKGVDGQGGTGGDSSVTLTQEEYEALTEEEKLNGLYYIYDTKRIYKNGVQYGASEPISLTMAEYEALKEAGAIDEQQEYLIEADDEGILLNAKDIGYSNAKSGIQATTVQDAIDKIAESSGSGEKNVQSDWNETDDTADGFIKNKPTIPEAYDDTALSNRVKTIEDNYAKSSDIPSLSEYATETWVNEQGFLTQHQDLSNYATKDEIPTVPSKVSELTNDSNYQTTEQVNSIVTTKIAKVVADAPEDFDTLKEMSDWIAGHEDDASAMNSAISDNKTAITALQTGKADKSEIPTTVAELSDSTDYAKKTNIPTTLPANGGNADTVNNHTVETNVPADAVFTDTIYDDTEVKGSIDELSSNLSQLEYSEVAGGKNLLDPNYFTSQIVKVGGIGNVNGVSWDCDKVNWYIEDLSGISFKENTVYTIMLYGKCKNNEQSLTNLCIEYTDGTNSIIMFSSKNTNSLALRVTDSNKTISKLAFYYGSKGTDLDPKKCGIFEGTIKESDFEPYIPSVKMLAEEVNQQNESLSVIGKCKNLLNPILQTTTINGITCTANGDGTYTLKGKSTSSSNTNFVISFSSPLKGKCKLIGCPSDIDSIAELQCNYNGVWDSKNTDHGKGSILDSTNLLTDIAIVIFPNVTVNNLVFKPMITTDLSATYDDFVPYTGNGYTLTHDVAELKNDLGSTDISSIGDGTVTGAINELNRNFSDKYIVRSYSANFTTNSGYGYRLVNSNITIDGYKIISTMVNQKDTSIAGATYFIANVFSSEQLFLNYYSSGGYNVQIEVLVLYIKE